MRIGKTLGFIASHPLNRGDRLNALLRYAKWQIGSRLVPGPVLFEWVGGTRVIVRPGETGMTQNIYCGLQEFPEMAYVLQVLGPNDLFLDVGANVGSYTVLACGASGARGFCFEPVPSTFARLCDNLLINKLLGRVTAMNIGIGDREGELEFTAEQDTTNHVVFGSEGEIDTIAVPIRTLHSLMGAECPTFIKIDVEGFEAPVLAGAGKTMENPSLHSVLMELNGAGHRYGYDDNNIARQLADCGFAPYDYDPFSRQLFPLNGKNPRRDNTLFVRNLQEVYNRLTDAPKVEIGSRDF